MKKILSLTLILFILTTNIVFGEVFFDTQNIENGIIGVEYSSNNSKIMIQKEDKKYTYDLNNQWEEFPLQMGNGNYTISLLEKTEGNKYRVVLKDKVVLDIEDGNKVFLGSIQMIHWDESMEPIKKAKELVKDLTKNEEKIEKIYQYIVNNIKYDYKKANTVKPGYLPEVDKIFEDNKGICYDYSSLLAAMLRSIGIPTKLVMGYSNEVEGYHAWNEVYIESKGQWVIIDTTIDAPYVQKNIEVNMIKKNEDYTKKKEY